MQIWNKKSKKWVECEKSQRDILLESGAYSLEQEDAEAEAGPEGQNESPEATEANEEGKEKAKLSFD